MEIVGDLENEEILGDEEKLRSGNIYSCNDELNSNSVVSNKSTGYKAQNNDYASRGYKENIINNNEDMSSNGMKKILNPHPSDFFNKTFELTESYFFI